MIDTHAHIHDGQFEADREAVLHRAKEVGVSKIITIGTSIAESRAAVDLAKRYAPVFATVSVHPEEYSKLPNENMRKKWMEELSRVAEEDKVVAIGECGLDYFAFGGILMTNEQKNVQQEGFRDHVRLAKHVGKPIVVHARESLEDIFEMLCEFVADVPAVVLHCYQGDARVTRKFLDLDDRILFSFAGNITYPVKKVLQGTKDDPNEVLAMIPLDRMLTETDCPYLAPQKYRGTRNEPAYVVEVAKKIAEVMKGISFEEVEQTTESNALRVFRLT